ncbi:hypothetical protein HYC85_003051 [Camellia sinensis]|uniref:Uncharacterized protein n=1 Tax=Camellia sinensis TaxID=4442 RepID=A0A7J7IA29_CAMSI|nr:hypothetical protein HYC85_003051 [Camellia sinensis]
MSRTLDRPNFFVIDIHEVLNKINDFFSLGQAQLGEQLDGLDHYTELVNFLECSDSGRNSEKEREKENEKRVPLAILRKETETFWNNEAWTVAIANGNAKFSLLELKTTYFLFTDPAALLPYFLDKVSCDVVTRICNGGNGALDAQLRQRYRSNNADSVRNSMFAAETHGMKNKIQPSS